MELTLLYIIVIFLLGYSTGVISAFFGIGGGFIMTPALNVLGLPMTNAVATGLSYTLITSTLGGIKHFLANNMIVKISLIVSVITIIGLRFSQIFVIYLDKLNIADFYIRLLYIVLLLSLGIIPLIKNNDEDDDNKNSFFAKIRELPPTINLYDNNQSSIWIIIVIGLIVGFLQGFLGVGGGFVLVPLFILILNIPAHKAIGTSLLTIFISSSFGSYYHIISGRVNLMVILILAIGTVLGVNFGSEAVKNISENKFETFYSIFLTLAAFGIIFKQLGLETISIIYTLTFVFLITIFILMKYYFQLKIPLIDRIIELKSSKKNSSIKEIIKINK